MIDPNHLTPENGFIEGCVVEIEYNKGRPVKHGGKEF